MTTEPLLTTILIGGSQTFYAFSNADGKQWLIPTKHMVTAMNLYQPSGFKGKGMKKFFPYLYGLGIARKVVKAEQMLCALNPELEEWLCRCFGVDEIEFSIFCGTPSVHQKITIQLSVGTRILGYAKVTDNVEVKELFSQEKEVLDSLAQRGLDRFPRCLFCGLWKEGVFLFVQTTNKTNHSSSDHRWGNRETNFIKEIHAKTHQHLPFEKTDFYRDLVSLEEKMQLLKGLDTGPVSEGIYRVMQTYKQQEVDFSLYHADFTPWNIYVEQGRLYAFDFEYARHTYPPYLDYFHFFTQTAIFEKHLSADGIAKLYLKQKNDIHELLSNESRDFAYLCYLLAVMAHYVQREKNGYNQSMMHCFRVWIRLITLLETK
jgi:hypothetical protein